ncbi:MAG: ABC transporter substrate-binding protein [Eubacteriales bacterium]
MKNWKTRVSMLGLAATMLLGTLTSCANPAGDTNSGSGGSGSTSGGGATSAGTTEGARALTVLLEQSNGWTQNFNPFIQGANQYTTGFIFEPLVIYDAYTQEEIMWLAEEIITEPDNRTLTIKVRQDIQWSDGEQFDADDVVFNFTYSKDKPAIDSSGNWAHGDDPGKIESVNKIDDYTLEIVMIEENRFHRSTLFFQNWMVPEHIWSEIDNPENYVYNVDNPVATGAFTEVVSFASEMVVLGRNPHYWKGEELEVDELHCPQFNSNDAALTLLQTGSIDWAHIFIANIEDTYIQGDANKQYWYGKSNVSRLSTNFQTPDPGNNEAFNDPAFKQAMSMAIDRVGLINSAIHGYLSTDVPTNSGLPANLVAYANPEAVSYMAPYVEYNLQGAIDLLAEAGYVDIDGDGYVETPSGLPIEFDIVSPAGWTDWNDGATIAAEGMRAVGINASSNAKDLSLVTQHWSAGDWDVMYSSNGNNTDIYRFYYDTIGDTSRAFTSTWWTVCQTNYVNDELSALIAQLPTATTDAEVSEITNEVEMFMAENMINIPLYYQGNWFVFNDARFTGWSATESDGQPALAQHDSKILQLLRLKAVD